MKIQVKFQVKDLAGHKRPGLGSLGETLVVIFERDLRGFRSMSFRRRIASAISPTMPHEPGEGDIQPNGLTPGGKARFPFGTKDCKLPYEAKQRARYPKKNNYLQLNASSPAQPLSLRQIINRWAGCSSWGCLQDTQ